MNCTGGSCRYGTVYWYSVLIGHGGKVSTSSVIVFNCLLAKLNSGDNDITATHSLSSYLHSFNIYGLFPLA